MKSTRDASGAAKNPLIAEFIVRRGLATGIETDTTATTVTDIIPINEFDDVSVLEPITISYSERMNPTSVRANISGTHCSDTICISDIDENGEKTEETLVIEIAVDNKGQPDFKQKLEVLGYCEVSQLEILLAELINQNGCFQYPDSR